MCVPSLYYLSSAAVFVIFCFLAIVSAQKLDTFSQQYGPFPLNQNIFEVEKPATITNGALQMTPDSASADFKLYNNSGRILYKKPFKLWDGDVASSKENLVASFNTSFLINIYRPTNDTPGEGLAFLIAADLNLPPNSYGEFLGLTNATTDGKENNHLLAVELDTFKQDFDPDDNHVGIDINGVRSVKTESLTSHNITIAPKGTKFYTIWVDYDGVKKFLAVYMAEAKRTGPTPPKPSSSIISYDLNLREILNQYSYFGFSASTGTNIQLNCVLRWNLTVHHFPDEKHPWLKTALGAGVPILALIIIGAVGYFGYYSRLEHMRSKPSLRVPDQLRLPKSKNQTYCFTNILYESRVIGDNLSLAQLI